MLSCFTFEAQLPESRAGPWRLALTLWSFLQPLCNLRKWELQVDGPYHVSVTDLLRSSWRVALIAGFPKESLSLTQTCRCISLVLWNWLKLASGVFFSSWDKISVSVFLFYSNCGFSIVLWETPRYIFLLHLTKVKGWLLRELMKQTILVHPWEIEIFRSHSQKPAFSCLPD